MKYYETIDKRVDEYRKIPISFDFTEEEKKELARNARQNPYIAQNRTLDENFRMMLSIFRKDGIEASFYGEKRYCFEHTLPFTGVLHKHEFIEIFYIIDGSYEQILLGEKRLFEAGEFVITDQNCEHSDYLTSQEASVLFIQLSSDYLDELLRSYDEKDELQKFLFHALNRQKKEQSFLQLQKISSEKETALHILEQLYEEIIENAPGVESICKGLLVRLLHHMCIYYRPKFNSNTKEGKEKATLFQVEQYVRLHYATVTSEDLEKAFHYHRNYYNLLFQKYRGCTFKKYLLNIRLEMAHSLFETSLLPVKEIIRKVGYENTSHFYHLYKEKYGLVPRPKN